MTTSNQLTICDEDEKILEIPLNKFNAPHTDLIIYYLNGTNHLFVQIVYMQVTGFIDNQVNSHYNKCGAFLRKNINK
jgi:hypothetical protein